MILILSGIGLFVAFFSVFAYIGYTIDLPKEERTGTQKVALKVCVILGSIMLFLSFGNSIIGILGAIIVVINFVNWNK